MAYRDCKWCKTRFRQTRKGHRYCSTACRVAAWRGQGGLHNPYFVTTLMMKQVETLSRDGLRKYWPDVPAPKWIEVICDAGKSSVESNFHCAFAVRRHTLGKEEPELIHADVGRIDEELPGPTPAEGIALVRAMEWVFGQRKNGTIGADEIAVFFSDNVPVAQKAIKGSTWGNFCHIWKALKDVSDKLKETGPVNIAPIPGWCNTVDVLTHEDYSGLPNWDIPSDHEESKADDPAR